MPDHLFTLLPESDDFDVLIIIPTVATASVLLPTLRRLRDRLDGYRAQVVVVRNPVKPDEAATAEQIIGAFEPFPDGLHVVVHNGDQAVGFSGAINRGLAIACGLPVDVPLLGKHSIGHPFGDGVPKVTVVLNDDVVPAHGWLRGIVEAFDEPYIHLTGEVPDRDGATIVRPVEEYGPIGMVGPVSNCAAGGQVYVDEDTTSEIQRLGPDRFAARWREDHAVTLRSAVFLSGFCTAFRRECLQALVAECSDPPNEFGDVGIWLPRLYDDAHFPIAGYEDNDIAHRADRLGWRAAIVVSNYLVHTGHETFKAHFPEFSFGLRNHGNYLSKWNEGGSVIRSANRLIAIYRVRFDVPFDLDLFRMSLASICTIVDGVAVLLTAPLSRVTTSEDWGPKVSGDVQELALAPGADVARLAAWVQRWTTHRPGNRAPAVRVELWTDEFNERDERNHAISMAEAMGADWILSVDHDEAIEPRATRASFDRLMNHPDPLIRAWDFSWVNHWNDQRTMNVSRPWGDAGTYVGGMRGFRMFRTNPARPRRIQAGTENGLHCGNVPLFDSVSIRTSGLRFRHFGYMRPQDRARKLDRYRTQDPNPDPNLIGGTSYDHIVMEENQTMSAFYPVNGIGLHMLLHDDRQAADLGRHLTSLYGLVDRIVLVWTGEWSEADREQWFVTDLRHGPKPDGVGAEKSGNLRPTMTLRPGLSEIHPLSFATGPGYELVRLAHLYGAEWVHQPLNDDFATARNAGIDALHGTPGLGWAVFVDPDEFIPATGLNALRRMAEATDAWGWLVRFRNQTGPGPNDFNVSENVRMTRLDEERIMRLTGRVHEQFTAATRSLVESGRKNVVRICPVEWTNTGLSLSPAAMEAKIERYRRLTELALTENPYDPGAWVTLGLFYANEGATIAHLECLQRAMASATRGEYLPHYEAGRLYMRLAKAALEEAEGRMGGHPDRKIVQSMLSFLESAAPPVPRTGFVAAGARPGLSDAEALSRLPFWPGPPDAPAR